MGAALSDADLAPCSPTSALRGANKAGPVSADDVKAVRAAVAGILQSAPRN